MFRRYREVLGHPGAMAFSSAALLARAPMSMTSIGIVLLVERSTGSYAVAGAVAATAGVCAALAGPLLARLVDRRGQRRVLLPGAIVQAVGHLRVAPPFSWVGGRGGAGRRGRPPRPRAQGRTPDAGAEPCPQNAPACHPGRVDEVLRQALEPVLRDLARHGLDEPRIEDRDWTEHPEQASAMLWSPDGSGSGVSVPRFATRSERVAEVADQVQEWAIEEQWGGARATNWPRCPSHPDSHPLKAATVSDAAVWVCPESHDVVAPIGRLPSPGRHVRRTS